MNKKLVRHAASFLMLLIIFAPVFVFAQDQYFTGIDQGQLELPSQDTTATEIVTQVINIILGLLGLIAVIIVLIGGFKWMTAAGSEDRVNDAKNTIKYGLIGLAIVLLAYVIVSVVIKAIYGVGSGTSTGISP